MPIVFGLFLEIVKFEAQLINLGKRNINYPTGLLTRLSYSTFKFHRIYLFLTHRH